MSAEKFIEFAKELKVVHPSKGLINLEVHSYLERLGHAFFKHQSIIGTKFRQGAFTTFTAAYALWTALYCPRKRIIFLSKTDRDAVAINYIVRRMMEHMVVPPATVKLNDHTIEFPNGSLIYFYTHEASRGKAIDIMILDEPAFVKDMDKWWKAICPCIYPNGQVIALSTTNGIGGWFYETYSDAVAGRNKFYAVDANYTEHPEYNDPEWVEIVKKNLGERGFQQEVLCAFLAPKETVYSSDLFKKFFNSLDQEESKKLIDHFKSVINGNATA